jgi:hypothetical protein
MTLRSLMGRMMVNEAIKHLNISEKEKKESASSRESAEYAHEKEAVSDPEYVEQMKVREDLRTELGNSNSLGEIIEIVKRFANKFEGKIQSSGRSWASAEEMLRVVQEAIETKNVPDMYSGIPIEIFIQIKNQIEIDEVRKMLNGQ